MDASQNQTQKLKYPRAILFIILNEFCERFSYYGMRTILVLYLNRKLMLEEDDATIVYHSFTLLLFFSCIFGPIGDSFLGKFKTILILSITCAIGSLVITVGAVEPWDISPIGMTSIGLILVAIGSGGIKPCVSTFGGEQFKLPEQAKQLSSYFSLFYFTVNVGSLISTIVTPMLHDDVKCFGMKDCFPAGFGLPALLMIISIILFVLGRFMYKIVPSSRNMVLKVSKCIGNAISTKFREKKTNPKKHWLDYAEAKHGKKLVMETKILLNVFVLYLPLPLFWALFEQQGSRWMIQATKMSGDIGFMEIKPDHMQIINPLLILLLIPLCDYVIYPLLSFLRIKRPLQKMALGGTLAGISFIISMIVQLKIDEASPKKLHMLWLVPQYFVMIVAEVMFSVTGLEFSFTQAPSSMKSVICACWLLTVSCGNLIVTIVIGVDIIHDQSMEFLLFACLMFVDMLIFMFLANRYKPIPLDELEEVAE